MHNANTPWIYALIILSGALQAWGPPMNGVLRVGLVNPWLASLVSFLPIVALLACVFLCRPLPAPSHETVSAMPWWAPLGGVVGAFAVVVGLMFVDTVGAGAFAGLLITSNFLMSLAIDRFGWFGMPVYDLTSGRMLGAALMVGGITLITRS